MIPDEDVDFSSCGFSFFCQPFQKLENLFSFIPSIHNIAYLDKMSFPSYPVSLIIDDVYFGLSQDCDKVVIISVQISHSDDSFNSGPFTLNILRMKNCHTDENEEAANQCEFDFFVEADVEFSHYRLLVNNIKLHWPYTENVIHLYSKLLKGYVKVQKRAMKYIR